jgi:hypothetical protein
VAGVSRVSWRVGGAAARGAQYGPGGQQVSANQQPTSPAMHRTTRRGAEAGELGGAALGSHAPIELMDDALYEVKTGETTEAFPGGCSPPAPFDLGTYNDNTQPTHPPATGTARLPCWWLVVRVVRQRAQPVANASVRRCVWAPTAGASSPCDLQAPAAQLRIASSQ